MPQPMKIIFTTAVRRTALLLAVLFTPLLTRAAIGPDTADANTTFLFHFDEAAGGSVTTNYGTVGGKAFTVSIGTNVLSSIGTTNVTTMLGGAGFSPIFTNADIIPGTNSGYMIGFAGASSSFTTDTGSARSPNAIAESVLGIGASANSPWTIEAMIRPNNTNFNQEIVCMDSGAS